MPAAESILARKAGDRLLEQGKLTPQQLEQVRRRQQRLNLPQHRAIVDLNFASEEDTWRALAHVNHLEFVDPVALDLKRETLRSEEHTSELQSRFGISYAVFCFNK